MVRASLLVVVACTAAGLAALPSSTIAAREERRILAADLGNRLLLLDAAERIVERRSGPPVRSSGGIQGLALAPDGRRAFVAVYRSAPASDALYETELQGKGTQRVARGLSPAVSPDGRRLAFLLTETRNDVKYRAALVVRTLATGRDRAISIGPRAPVGTPPEMILNWSPDGRRIALFGTRQVRIVDVATARNVEAERGVRGLLAPVFLDSRTLVGLANCCIGPQRLVAVDLRTGTRSTFATLSAAADG